MESLSEIFIVNYFHDGAQSPMKCYAFCPQSSQFPGGSNPEKPKANFWYLCPCGQFAQNNFVLFNNLFQIFVNFWGQDNSVTVVLDPGEISPISPIWKKKKSQELQMATPFCDQLLWKIQNENRKSGFWCCRQVREKRRSKPEGPHHTGNE